MVLEAKMGVDTMVEVTMPAMGDSVTEGTILEWHKREGERVDEDETLVEISTDKVDTEIPAPTAGTVAKILSDTGDTVPVGAVLAEISPEKASSGGGDGPGGGSPGGGNGPGGGSSSGEGDRRSGGAEIDETAPAEPVDIAMPHMGESVTEGVILEWAKQPGDAIEEEETLVEISTDKVDAEVPSPETGVLAEVLVQAGETVQVGDVIARVTPGADGKAKAAAPAGAAERAAQAPAAAATAAPPTTDVNASPVAKRVALELGVDLGRMQGSGPGNRVTKADVIAASKTGAAAAGAPAVAATGAPAVATTAAKQTPLKGAAAVLGNSLGMVVEVYAESNFELAKRIMREIG